MNLGDGTSVVAIARNADEAADPDAAGPGPEPTK